jgi:phage tail-like protein
MTSPQGPQPGQMTDPHLGFRFAIEIGGIVHAHFAELSGMQLQTEVFEFKEGGLNDYAHKLPGRTTHSNVTLKRGLTDSAEVSEWFTRFVTAKDKTTELKDVSIIQFDQEGNQKYRWDLGGAFPVKWSGPSYNAATSSVAVESFELAFTTFIGAKAG